jgi:DNA-binding LytR/AlgR family response regulator
VTTKTPYPVLVIGENPPGGLLSILSSYPMIGKVHRAMHPYQVESFLRNHAIAIIFISVRDWNIHLFTALHQRETVPKLVIIKGRLDRFDKEALRNEELVINEPYTGVQLKNICSEFDRLESKHDGLNNYDCLWFLVDRKWRRIPCDAIELLQKHPQSQVLICTKDTDWMVYGSLAGYYEKLPKDRFVRISDQLVVPTSGEQKIHKTKGYPFRGGWMPVIRKMAHFSPHIIVTHEA